MGCGINRRDAFSYTLAMTAIAAYPNRYDKAKAFLAEHGYDDVSDAALGSVRHTHTDEILAIMRDGVSIAVMLAWKGEISHDELAAFLGSVALKQTIGYLEKQPAADPTKSLRALQRRRTNVHKQLADRA